MPKGKAKKADNPASIEPSSATVTLGQLASVKHSDTAHMSMSYVHAQRQPPPHLPKDYLHNMTMASYAAESGAESGDAKDIVQSRPKPDDHRQRVHDRAGASVGAGEDSDCERQSDDWQEQSSEDGDSQPYGEEEDEMDLDDSSEGETEVDPNGDLDGIQSVVADTSVGEVFACKSLARPVSSPMSRLQSRRKNLNKLKRPSPQDHEPQNPWNGMAQGITKKLHDINAYNNMRESCRQKHGGTCGFPLPSQGGIDDEAKMTGHNLNGLANWLHCHQDLPKAQVDNFIRLMQERELQDLSWGEIFHDVFPSLHRPISRRQVYEMKTGRSRTVETFEPIPEHAPSSDEDLTPPKAFTATTKQTPVKQASFSGSRREGWDDANYRSGIVAHGPPSDHRETRFAPFNALGITAGHGSRDRPVATQAAMEGRKPINHLERFTFEPVLPDTEEYDHSGHDIDSDGYLHPADSNRSVRSETADLITGGSENNQDQDEVRPSKPSPTAVPVFDAPPYSFGPTDYGPHLPHPTELKEWQRESGLIGERRGDVPSNARFRQPGARSPEITTGPHFPRSSSRSKPDVKPIPHRLFAGGDTVLHQVDDDSQKVGDTSTATAEIMARLEAQGTLRFVGESFPCPVPNCDKCPDHKSRTLLGQDTSTGGGMDASSKTKPRQPSRPVPAPAYKATDHKGRTARPGQPGYRRVESPLRPCLALDTTITTQSDLDRLAADLSVGLKVETKVQKTKKKKSKGKRQHKVVPAFSKAKSDDEPESDASDAKEEDVSLLIAMKRQSNPKLAQTPSTHGQNYLSSAAGGTSLDRTLRNRSDLSMVTGDSESIAMAGSRIHPVEKSEETTQSLPKTTGTPVTPSTSMNLPPQAQYSVPNTPSLTPKKTFNTEIKTGPTLDRSSSSECIGAWSQAGDGLCPVQEIVATPCKTSSPQPVEAVKLRAQGSIRKQPSRVHPPAGGIGDASAGMGRRTSVHFADDMPASVAVSTSSVKSVASPNEADADSWVHPKVNGYRSRGATPQRDAESQDREAMEEGRIETDGKTGRQRIILDGPRPAPPYERTVFCADIPTTMAEEQTRRALFEHFQRFEPVDKIHLIMDEQWDESHAFVVFKARHAVDLIINSSSAAAFRAPSPSSSGGDQEYTLRLEPSSAHRVLLMGVNRDRSRKEFSVPHSNTSLQLNRRLPSYVAYERYLEHVGFDAIGRSKFRVRLRLDLEQVEIGQHKRLTELERRRQHPVELAPGGVRVHLATAESDDEVVRRLCEPFGPVESITANLNTGQDTHTVVFRDRDAAVQAQSQLKFVDGVTCFWLHKPSQSGRRSTRPSLKTRKGSLEQVEMPQAGSATQRRHRQDRVPRPAKSFSMSDQNRARSAAADTMDWPSLPRMSRYPTKTLPSEDNLDIKNDVPVEMPANSAVVQTPSPVTGAIVSLEVDGSAKDTSWYLDGEPAGDESRNRSGAPSGSAHAGVIHGHATSAQSLPMRKKRNKQNKASRPHRSPRWKSQQQDETGRGESHLGRPAELDGPLGVDEFTSRVAAAESGQDNSVSAAASALGLTDLAVQSTGTPEDDAHLEGVSRRMSVVVDDREDDQEVIRARFKAYGRIVNLDAVDGQPIVTFSSVASARDAVRQQQLQGKGVRLLVDSDIPENSTPSQTSITDLPVVAPCPTSEHPSPLPLHHDTHIHAPKPSRLTHILHEDITSSASPTPPHSARFRRRFSDPGRATPKLEIPPIVADDSRSDGATVIESAPPSPIVSDAGSVQVVLADHRPAPLSLGARQDASQQDAKSANSSTLPDDVAAKLRELEREVEMYKRLAQMHGIPTSLQSPPEHDMAPRHALPLTSPPPHAMYHQSPPPLDAHPSVGRDMDGRIIQNKALNSAREAQPRVQASPRPVRLMHQEDGTLIPVYEHQELLEYRRARSIEDARGRYQDQNQAPLHRYPVQTGGHSPKKRDSLGSISVHDLFGLQRSGTQGGLRHQERVETPVSHPFYEAGPPIGAIPMHMMPASGFGEQYAGTYDPETGSLPPMPYHTGMLPPAMYSDTPLPEGQPPMPPFSLPLFPAYQSAEPPTPFGYAHQHLPFEHGHLQNSPRGPTPFLPPAQSMPPVTAFRPQISPHKGGTNNRNANNRR